MFKEMLTGTLKINEAELKAMGQISYEEKAQDASTEEKVVEVTPELVEGLIKKLPELEGIDSAKLLAGMLVEMEHIKSVGNDIEAIARIAADHIKEFAGKDYYAALAIMEDGLKAPVVEEPKAEEIAVEAEEEKEETPEEQAKEEIEAKEEKVEETKVKEEVKK